ncbi:MAG: folate-binding protein [Boseongicola sp.]|nr:folate-binding protein [Boseongicola sp.]
MEQRKVFRITGKDRVDFLQNLVTNDVSKLDDGLVYAALLTPQGKYLADFFLVPDGEAILLDVAATLAPDLIRRLAMYKLRADVAIAETTISPVLGLGDTPSGAFADPRHVSLGWRAYDGREAEAIDLETLRVIECIPESGVELLPNESYPLESGFERLNGVDFKKGCYVGQEVTARMKHKTELKKGLVTVSVEGSAQPGTDILTEDGKPAGTLFTQSGGKGIAYLRFDRAKGPMKAGDADVTANL